MPRRVRKKDFRTARLPFEPKSAAHRISSISKPDLEMLWFKGKPGELRPGVIERYTNTVIPSEKLPTDRSQIHTHLYLNDPTNEAFRTYRQYGHMRSTMRVFSYPSSVDIRSMIRDILSNSSIRFWHVATTNKNRDVVGYFSCFAGNKFQRWVRDTFAGRSFEQAWDAFPLHQKRKPGMIWGYRSKTSHEYSGDIIRFLQRKGLIVRATPMPGYHFVKGRFVRQTKPKKK